MPLNSLPSVKTVNSSLARGHMGGPTGNLELGPGTRHGLGGSIYKKKVLQDPGPNTHTAATIRKEVLTPPTPPPPPPPKRGTQVQGGGVRGSKSKTSLGDPFWS